LLLCKAAPETTANYGSEIFITINVCFKLNLKVCLLSAVVKKNVLNYLPVRLINFNQINVQYL